MSGGVAAWLLELELGVELELEVNSVCLQRSRDAREASSCVA